MLGGPFTGPVISDARWIRLIVRPEPDGDPFALDLLDSPYVGTDPANRVADNQRLVERASLREANLVLRQGASYRRSIQI